MAKVEGLSKLSAVIQARIRAAKKAAAQSAVVGYTAEYAAHVHENLEAYHPIGSAKFLEQPAREMQDVFAKIIRDATARGVPAPRALLLAGLRLQRESMLLCPIQTGTLRASAFTRLEKAP